MHLIRQCSKLTSFLLVLSQLFQVISLQQDTLTIEQLRVSIDSIDNRIVELLNERARVVIEVGKLKSGSNMEFHVPGRERQIYERLLVSIPARSPMMPCAVSTARSFLPVLPWNRP